jgi:hypothetical protein
VKVATVPTLKLSPTYVAAQVCAGTSAVIKATASAGASVTWLDQTTGGSAGGTAPNGSYTWNTSSASNASKYKATARAAQTQHGITCYSTPTPTGATVTVYVKPSLSNTLLTQSVRYGASITAIDLTVTNATAISSSPATTDGLTFSPGSGNDNGKKFVLSGKVAGSWPSEEKSIAATYRNTITACTATITAKITPTVPPPCDASLLYEIEGQTYCLSAYDCAGTANHKMTFEYDKGSGAELWPKGGSPFYINACSPGVSPGNGYTPVKRMRTIWGVIGLDLLAIHILDSCNEGNHMFTYGNYGANGKWIQLTDFSTNCTEKGYAVWYLDNTRTIRNNGQ